MPPGHPETSARRAQRDLTPYSTRELEDAMAFLSLSAARGIELPRVALAALEELLARIATGIHSPGEQLSRLQRYFREHPVPPSLLAALRALVSPPVAIDDAFDPH